MSAVRTERAFARATSKHERIEEGFSGEKARKSVTVCSFASLCAEKNADAQRLAYRAGLVRSMRASAVILTYLKSYLLITVFLLICSLLLASTLSPLATLLVLVLLIAVLACAAYFFSVCCRSIVDFDVDSFIFDRGYNSEVHFDPAVLAVIPQAPAARSLWPWYLNPSMLSRDLL